MDLNELFLACRRGDLCRVQFLVEQKEVELNVRDKWDSSPLYYACLCGHEELVKYLLENGARCEANTFDGERCLYGALSNEIRNTLKNFKAVTTSTIRRDLYNEFLRRSLDRGFYSDVTFMVHGESFTAHRCILAARSQYFAEMFTSKWDNKSIININHKLVVPWAFKAILQYLYTARFEAHFDQVGDIERLAQQCHLDALVSDLEEKMKKVVSFESTKPGVNVTVIAIEPAPDATDLQDDLCLLSEQALPPNYYNEDAMELPFPPENVQSYPDIIFQVEQLKFECHKAFMCGRSDYLKVLVDDHFGEGWIDESGLPIIPLHGISAAVFVQVVNYIYQDRCELNAQNVYDVLVYGDMYLLPGLKRICANAIGKFMDAGNTITILKTARFFNLPRLEDQCAHCIAINIERLVGSDDFAQLVKEDASSVQHRQETDSIPIIDDIRFHITNFVQTFSDMYEADQKLLLIDSFLEQLGLDA